MDAANLRLSRAEQIKRYVILPAEWSPGGGELTPTQKLRRKPIAAKYTTEIDAMYAAHGPREQLQAVSPGRPEPSTVHDRIPR
jgi:long-subunit acyl-CoA synthetase (AMP-forming)